MIQSEEVQGLAPYKRDTGMVFQGYALFPHKTVAENIGFGLKMEGVAEPEREERIAEFLELVDLPGYQDRYPEQLSGGQQQRVALARALVIEPSVLLLDEPLSNLDLKLRKEMRFELKRIQEELGITTIYVTHDQEEALAMSDRILVMNDGREAQIGSPTEIYNNPENEFVANFIGEANIITGTVSGIGSDKVGLDVDLPGAGIIDIPTDDVTTSMDVGDEIMVNIRPENVRLSPVGQNDPDPVLSGTLTTSTFHGKNTRYLVQVDEQEFIVETSGQSTVGEYTHGQEVGLTWDPAEILVIKNGHDNQTS
jgi:spermidine/putrescine transport system ATP-binding protein